MVEVEIVIPDITEEENERRVKEVIKYFQNLTYEDLRTKKEA